MTTNKKPWNGRDTFGRYQYPAEDIKSWDMTIDEGGTVYYKTRERQPREMVWCPAHKLSAHLKHLEQIGVRNAVAN